MSSHVDGTPNPLEIGHHLRAAGSPVHDKEECGISHFAQLRGIACTAEGHEHAADSSLRTLQIKIMGSLVARHIKCDPAHLILGKHHSLDLGYFGTHPLAHHHFALGMLKLMMARTGPRGVFGESYSPLTITAVTALPLLPTTG